MEAQLIRFGKFLSLVLRHQPQRYGLTLDPRGWAQIDELIAAANRAGVPLTHSSLQEVVAHNDKQRFAISDDGLAIRARQGHSIAVDLELVPLVLTVDSGAMHRDGYQFYRSENGVWLVETVPVAYLAFPGP